MASNAHHISIGGNRRCSRIYTHLIHSCLFWLILTLWHIQCIATEETQQPRPALNIRMKRQIDTNGDCFGAPLSLLSYSIKETYLPGTIVGTIPINGLAHGANATISLTLGGDNPDVDKYLRIDTENKTLVLTRMVDRDGPTGLTHLSTIIRCQQLQRDGVTVIPFPIPYEVQVDVGGVNDNTPQFLNLPYQVSISELTRVGTTVFKGFMAVDDDGDNRDGQIIYSIEPYAEDPMSNQWFSIRNSGRNEITVERELDYERKAEWQVLLQARDNGLPENNKNYTVVTINILDGNDLPPIYVPCNVTNITVEDCINLTYSATIMERIVLPDPIDFWPGSVYAVDADENVTNAEPIYYTLYDGTPENYAEYFSINSTSGEVRLLKPVCFNDVQRFDIEIKASEGPLPSPHNSSAFLAIGVVEKNEHTPEFNETEYIGYVYENSPKGTQIKATPNLLEPLRIAAVDQDMDAACGTSLMYSLHDSSGSFILMEQEVHSVYVVTNRELDREIAPNYTLDVVATELNTEDGKESAPTKVTVVILDRNDNAPAFKRNQYSTEANRYKVDVRENHPVDAAVMLLHTIDPDSPTSDYIHISFEYVTNPNSGRPFRMQRISNTSVAIMLEPGVYLNHGESHVVSLQATDALDESLKSPVVYVELEILQSNATHAPRFSQTTYTTSASEGLPIGAFLTTITAMDPDDEDVLTYSIDGGDVDDTFHIDPASGDITIQKELDRETTPEYLLNVTAFDGNLSTTAYLMITVLDINDNNPEFNTSWPSTFIVLEGRTDAFVGQVMAYDLDQEDTKNSAIQYSVSSKYFTIDAINGTIYTKVALDREQQERYELSVVAIDSAAAARTSNLIVTVIIQDVNDNGPVFEKVDYLVELPEEHLAQDFLTLQALDVDENAVLEYGITAGDTSIFTIGRKTGKLSLLRPLDYETFQMHRVNVTVTDVEIDKMENNSTAMVTIIVTDVNDHRPEFTKQEYEGAVLRTADLSTVVVDNILAIDGDLSTTPFGQVQYKINPPNDYFIITDPTKGIIVTKSSLKSAQEFYNLTVLAFDGGPPTMTMGARAHIIIDIRVEKPIFPDPILRVNSLKEGQPAGSHVVDVEAKANRGDEITYIIINDEQNLFRIESVENVGKIYTNQILDRESISTYVIDVQATLNNGTTSSNRKRRKRETDTNVIEVIIELGDINDNPPEFLQDKYFIGVSQDAGVATTIITMQAVDFDSGNNSIIQYSLESSPTDSNDDDPIGLFTIGSDTGIISTAKMLPMTTKPTAYEVVALGMEKFSTEFDPASTTVSIAPINNMYRAVLVGTVPQDLMEENIKSVKKTLQELLDALVFIEDVSQMKYGENLALVDPSGSDTTFYAINTTNGLPLETEKIISNLEDNKKELDALYSNIVSNGTWVETRPVGVGKAAVINDHEPTIEAIALICLAIVLFVACVLAIVVIVISWKKTTKMRKRREMEREKQARVYLPMYSGFNPYANNDEMEIANPVYFDDQSVQVNDELFPNGAPTFLREAEVQEATMEFAPEESDEEANAVANSIAAACVGTGSDKSSYKDIKDTYPPSSGPPSYTSQENTPLPNLVYDADSLPRKVPPQPDRPPPPPPAPSEPPPAPPSKPPAYDNHGVDIADEQKAKQDDLPTTQPRTDSLPREDKNYSPVEESNNRSGSAEPMDVDDDPNNVHLVKIYRPPSRFDDRSPSTTDSSSREHTNGDIANRSPNHIKANHSPHHSNHNGKTSTGLANDRSKTSTRLANDRSKTSTRLVHERSKTKARLANGKPGWEPEEVLTTAL